MNKALFIIIFLCGLNSQAFAQPLDMTTFAKLPLQHDGRIKPLENFAREIFQDFEGSSAVKNIAPIHFLAEALFNPTDMTQRPLFKIRNKNIKEILDLNQDTYNFSLSEIIPALQQKREILEKLLLKEDANLTSIEKELLDIYNAAVRLRNIITSLQILLPLQIGLDKTILKELNIPQQDAETFLALKKHEEKLQTYFENKTPEAITDAERAFLFQLSVIEQNTDNQNIFRIMPPEWPLNKTGEWQSPWHLVNMGLSGPKSANYLTIWQNISTAYREKNPQNWDDQTKIAFDHVLSFSKIETSEGKLSLEVSYLSLNPYFYAVIFYVVSSLLAIALLSSKVSALNIVTITALLTGACFQFMAIIMRVMILERPPVSTLYESVIFVSLICVVLALIIAYFQKDKSLTLLSGALCGVIFYFVANYLASDGDTLKVLTAVLNTNFWLATHVITITAGYGFCVLTALLAHFYLYLRLFKKQISGNLPSVIFTLALCSLLLTAIGTILGGIWADQSWGRFWGWDPKENGALLIVLWLIWAIHGKIAGQLKELGFMVTIAGLNIIVALAWFGVNLLNVGLHSYGFISGIAFGLSAFCAIELALISIPSYLVYKRDRDAA